jgi:hypothetical protein
MPFPQDTTLLRWAQYPPELFIRQVLHGDLLEAVNLASVTARLYAQAVNRTTGSLGEQASAAQLRERFTGIRTCMTEAADIIREAEWDGSAPAAYIYNLLERLTLCMECVTMWIRAAQADPDLDDLTLSNLQGRRVTDAISEIEAQANSIIAILRFALQYHKVLERRR